MSTRRPFDDLADLFTQIPVEDGASNSGPSVQVPEIEGAPHDDISHILTWLGEWQLKTTPKLDESHICVFVSSYNGIGDQNSLRGFIDSASMGQVPVAKLCKERGVGLRVLEMAPEMPHVVSDSWPEKECMAATAFGMEATAAGGDILGLAALAPGDDEYSLKFCQEIVSRFIIVNQKGKQIYKGNTLALEVLDFMRSCAGREVAAMVGALIAARSRRLPVLIEGWSGLAAVSIVSAIDQASVDHVKVASIENGFQAEIARKLGMQPILGVPVNLGTGCGVALALSAIAPMLNLVK